MPPVVTKHLLIPHTELWCHGTENHKFSAAQQSLVAGKHFFQALECGFSHVTSMSSGSLLVSLDLTPWLWAFTAVYMDHCTASLNAGLEENRKAL